MYDPLRGEAAEGIILISRHQRGSMFSFKLHTKDERYVPAHAYLIKEEFDPDKVDEEEKEAMDTNPEEDAPFEQFVFPPSRCFDCIGPPAAGQCNFRREWIPPTLLPFNPGQLKALESIDAITADQKFTLGVYTALPMPVHVSPVITLFLDNVPPKATPPRKDRYMSWWQSAFQLRSVAFLAYTAAVPYHSSVSNAFPRQCYDEEFIPQIQAYEELHRIRLEELFASCAGAEGTPAPAFGGSGGMPSTQLLQRFIEYAEDFSLYYIHSLERYLWKVLIEPHLQSSNSPLTLEHLLTPAIPGLTLSQCENVKRARACVKDFFEFHVAATHLHEQRHAGDDYVKRNTFNLGDIERRITMTPPTELHGGYLDRQTAQEYWEFHALQ